MYSHWQLFWLHNNFYKIKNNYICLQQIKNIYTSFLSHKPILARCGSQEKYLGRRYPIRNHWYIGHLQLKWEFVTDVFSTSIYLFNFNGQRDEKLIKWAGIKLSQLPTISLILLRCHYDQRIAQRSKNLLYFGRQQSSVYAHKLKITDGTSCLFLANIGSHSTIY